MFKQIIDFFNPPKNSLKMNQNLLTSLLQKSKDNKEIISIWQYNSDKSSAVGYVTEISDEHLNLKHYTPYGKCDGNMFIR